MIECHLVSGGFDYLLKFVVKGIAQYQEMMEQILERNLGVSKYFSYIVIKVSRDPPPAWRAVAVRSGTNPLTASIKCRRPPEIQ